jgi:hypothetical protein
VLTTASKNNPKRAWSTARVFHVPPPFDWTATEKQLGGTQKKGGKNRFFSKTSPRKIGWLIEIDVDEDGPKVLAGTLSLIGKLFETYFVRLIGTPNQRLKNDPRIRPRIEVSV